MPEFDYDVIVAGGGPSGCAAAESASAWGASVLLVESDTMLGGAATGALVGPWQTFHGPSGPIIGGFGQRMVDKLMAVGASPGHLPDPIGFAPSVTPIDPDWLRIILDQTLKHAGVKILLGHRVTGVETRGGLVRGVAMAAGDRRSTVTARVFIDATGDGELCARAEVPMELDPEPQPMSLLFRVSGFENEPVVKYQKSHPEEFYMPRDRSVLDRGYPGVSGFFRHVAEAREQGRLHIPRDRILFFGSPYKGEVVVNTTRMTGYHPLSELDRAQAMLEGLAQVEELFKFLRENIPGFEHSRLSRIASRIGVRESRRLVGRYILNENELIGGEMFDDAVALGGFPLDIHKPDAGLETRDLEGKGFYSIPLRCLLNNQFPNLITVGKCISVTHAGFSSTRVMPTCMAVGEAGGVAAGVLASDPEMDVTQKAETIRQRLRNRGAILEL